MQNLANLINYQEGSVVSRELLKTENGSITLFAFGKDEGLSKHQTPFDVFVYLLDGKAEIIVGDKINQLSTGEFLQIPANIPHKLKALENFKMLLTMMK